VTITENTQIYFCEHMQKARQENPNAVSYVNIYAGENVRFFLCRLCSTMALGTIIGERIKEAIDPRIVERHDFV
jgi:hypothetical protein